ncbi:MAG: site-2 protease family protein [Lachnospiraceae bacterium]|nr:site-2 protease family protein [Lachnospiraceae bacterium]
MFCVIVLMHEFGHFIIARMNHISVVEFSIGMGPCLCSFTRNGTRFAIRLLPIGGACMFEGEDGKYTNPPEEEEGGQQEETGEKEALASEEESSFARNTDLDTTDLPFPKAPVWGRIATVFAGPFFNFILAFIGSMIIIGSYGVDIPKIQKLSEEGAAVEAGLQEGDLIRKLDGKKIHLYRQISLYSMLNRGEDVTIEYERDGKVGTVVVTPKYSPEAGRYYMGLMGVGSYEKFGILKTAQYSFYEVGYWIETVIKSLEQMLQGKVKKDDVAGPVGMAQMVNDVYTESKPDGLYYIWLNMLNFCVLLSANLGVMNLLPFPALDGGRLVFLFLEVLRGKPIPPEKEGVVHLIGMVCLMALMVFIFYNDLTKIF